MILRASKIDADTAYHYGLVQYLVDVSQAEDKALEYVTFFHIIVALPNIKFAIIFLFLSFYFDI